ncbi:MAG: triose-phosphate isomerase [Halioglobus sp.]|nr:triose-phosphate isomerase [Halioglobus sp.]
MRQRLVVGNWKMHGSRDSVDALLSELIVASSPGGVGVAVCPTYLHIHQALALCAGSSVAVGAQDCSAQEEGAYTGEVAAPMLADAGCDWVILGHSERRQYHAESDALVAAKLVAALDAGLRPILCVGETREQRESGAAESVVDGQLKGALGALTAAPGLVIAYEPVWAIGTGLTATPAEAQAMHAFIRGELDGLAGLGSDSTCLLYGGSVKADNANELFAEEDIDGALVGGASLKAADFLAIVNAAG